MQIKGLARTTGLEEVEGAAMKGLAKLSQCLWSDYEFAEEKSAVLGKAKGSGRCRKKRGLKSVSGNGSIIVERPSKLCAPLETVKEVEASSGGFKNQRAAKSAPLLSPKSGKKPPSQPKKDQYSTLCLFHAKIAHFITANISGVSVWLTGRIM